MLQMPVLILRTLRGEHLAPPHNRLSALTMYTMVASSYTTDWAPSSTVPRVPGGETVAAMLPDGASALPPATPPFPH